MYWIQGTGMWEAAVLAQEKINAAGGINGHLVELFQASDHPDYNTDPSTETGTLAMLQLIGNGVDFVQGGFRTEAVLGERAVAMENHKIFTITGASTDELIDHPNMVTYPDTVRANYAKYKYMFRTTPVNSTILFKSIAGFLKYVMILKLMPIYTRYQAPLKIAVVSENLAWTTVMHAYLTNPGFWNVVMGMQAYGGVNVVYQNKVDPIGTDWVPGVVAALDASGAKLIIEVISGPSGRAFVTRWGTVGVDAMLSGIDVPGQEIALHWTATTPEGETVAKCQTESFLVTAGGADDPNSGNPINTVGPVKTADFYRDYFTRWHHAPIYTSYGSFDTLMGLKETILTWITRVGHDWPPANQAEYDLLIPILEKTNRAGLVGQFKYTGPNPGNHGDYSDYDPATAGDQPYPYLADNPTMMGTTHDVYSVDLGPTWPTSYTRALVASWQAERLEIVFPVDRPYSKILALPDWMYPYPTDINQDGKHDITDIAIVSFAIDTTPTSARWQFAADYPTKDLTVDIDDLTLVAYDFGVPIPLPLP
jgi:ABC-type branched-subunit amino acid transport system substrate-binding protein